MDNNHFTEDVQMSNDITYQRYSKEERETVILTSDADDTWRLSTSQKKIMNLLDRLGEVPTKTIIDKFGNEYREYVLDYKQIIPKKKRKDLSEEQREALKERVSIARSFKK